MFYSGSGVEHAGELMGPKGRRCGLDSGLHEGDVIGSTSCVGSLIEEYAVDRDVCATVGIPSCPIRDVLGDSFLVSPVRAVNVAKCLDVGVRVQFGSACDEIAVRC